MGLNWYYLVMVKITRLNDYAFLLLCHLAEAGDAAVSSRETARATGLPLPTVSKLLKKLAAAGIVQAERGARGGYRLARRPDQIRVADVIAAVDGPVALTECASREPDCDRIGFCELRPNWLRINAAIRRLLMDITLEDMGGPLPGPDALRRRAAEDPGS